MGLVECLDTVVSGFLVQNAHCTLRSLSDKSIGTVESHVNSDDIIMHQPLLF